MRYLLNWELLIHLVATLTWSLIHSKRNQQSHKRRFNQQIQSPTNQIYFKPKLSCMNTQFWQTWRCPWGKPQLLETNIFVPTLYGKQPYESTQTCDWSERASVEIQSAPCPDIHRWQFLQTWEDSWKQKTWGFQSHLKLGNTSQVCQMSATSSIKWQKTSSDAARDQAQKIAYFLVLHRWKIDGTSHPIIQLLITKHHQKQLHLWNLICFSFWPALLWYHMTPSLRSPDNMATCSRPQGPCDIGPFHLSTPCLWDQHFWHRKSERFFLSNFNCYSWPKRSKWDPNHALCTSHFHLSFLGLRTRHVPPPQTAAVRARAWTGHTSSS